LNEEQKKKIFNISICLVSIEKNSIKFQKYYAPLKIEIADNHPTPHCKE
jgi:hypothetical protein